MNKIFSALLISFSVTAFAASDASATTLTEVLAYTYNTNPSLLAERATLRATDEAYAQAFAGWLPTATVSGDRDKESVKAGNRPSTSNYAYTRDFTITQPIFNGGGTIAQMHRAENQIKAGQATLKRTEQTVFLNAISAYMDVISTEEVLKLSQKNIEALQKNLTSTQERFRLGEVTNTDQAQANSRLSRATADQRRAISDAAIARGNFKSITGIDPVTLTFPEEAKISAATIDEAISIASANNPSNAISKHVVKAAKNQVSAAKAVLLPTVSLRENIRDTYGFIGLGGGEYDTKTALINVSIPLYQAGGEYSRIRESKNTVERREFDAESTARDVIQSTLRAWQVLEAARASLKSSQDAASTAGIALKGVMQEAEYGSRTVLDVLNAEQELYLTQTEIVRAKRDNIISSYTLKSALGELTAEGLKLPVTLYNPLTHLRKTKYHFAGF
jgi:outer membrane protein